MQPYRKLATVYTRKLLEYNYKRDNKDKVSMGIHSSSVSYVVSLIVKVIWSTRAMLKIRL